MRHIHTSTTEASLRNVMFLVWELELYFIHIDLQFESVFHLNVNQTNISSKKSLSSNSGLISELLPGC